MKILTIGESPYLLTSTGKLHSRAIRYLNDNHDLISAVWNHDKNYFMPNDDGLFFYEFSDKVCSIHPFELNGKNKYKDIVKLIENENPDVVFSIGHYYDTDFIYEIKKSKPLIKWVCLLLIPSPQIEKSYLDKFSLAEGIILTSYDSYKYLTSGIPVDSYFAPVGSSKEKYFPSKKSPDNFRLICSSNNTKDSNLASVVASSCMASLPLYLHTNINDYGYYDVDSLISNMDYKNIVKLPEKFSSIQENISDESMRNEYSNSVVYLDLSLSSATSMSAYEAMSCGCIPLLTPTVSTNDFLKYLPEEFCVAPSTPYFGDRHEIWTIASIKGVAAKIRSIYMMWKNDVEKYFEIREKCINVSKGFLSDNLEKNIGKALNRAYKRNNPIMVVEEIT